jgi:hypothetical protein
LTICPRSERRPAPDDDEVPLAADRNPGQILLERGGEAVDQELAAPTGAGCVEPLAEHCLAVRSSEPSARPDRDEVAVRLHRHGLPPLIAPEGSRDHELTARGDLRRRDAAGEREGGREHCRDPDGQRRHEGFLPFAMMNPLALPSALTQTMSPASDVKAIRSPSGDHELVVPVAAAINGVKPLPSEFMTPTVV